MHGKHGPGAARDRALDLCWITMKSSFFAIHEHRPSLEIKDGFAGSSKSHGWENYFVAFGQSDGSERKMQSGSARIDGNSVTCTNEAAKRRFKLQRAWTSRQPSAPEHIHNSPNLLLFD
jgi:hypothetical protein